MSDVPGKRSPSAPRSPSAISTLPSSTWLACLRTSPSGELPLNTVTFTAPRVRSSTRAAHGSATSRWKKLCGPRKWLNLRVTGSAAAQASALSAQSARKKRRMDDFLPDTMIKPLSVRRARAQFGADPCHERLQGSDLAIEPGELRLDGRDLVHGRLLPARCLGGRSLDLGSAAQQMRPAVLARAGQARQLYDERPRRPGGEFLKKGLDGGNVRELVQSLAIASQLARRLGAAQHQHGQERRSLRRNLQHTLEVVRIARYPSAARLAAQVGAPEPVERDPHSRLGRFHHGRAAGLLVAARQPRI